VGEDEGFNGIVVRSNAGESLLDSSNKAGDLICGELLTPEQLDDFQPHQVSKKTKLLARYEGLLEAGSVAIDTPDLRLEVLGMRLSLDERMTEQKNTLDRALKGRFIETD
jgi:coenzyme F420 hydrogenase subunit beta